MQIVITLDVTNDPEEMGVNLDCITAAALDAALEAVEQLGLKTKNLVCTGIGAKVKGG